MTGDVISTISVWGRRLDWWEVLVPLVVVMTVWITPKGRRLLVAVPLVVVVAACALLVADGRAQLRADAKEAAAPKQADAAAQAKACALARTYAESDLPAQARAQVLAAIADDPKLSNADCTAAIGLLKAIGVAPTQVEVSAASASTAVSEPSATLYDAGRRGIEHRLEPVLNPSGTAADRLVLGPYEWLLLALILLACLVSWTSMYFWVSRRLSWPAVTLAAIDAGDDGAKKASTAFAAELRGLLFEDRLSTATPTPTISDDVAGVIAESGVGGAKFISLVVSLCQKLLRSTNSVTVKITMIGDGTKAAMVEVTDDHSRETLTTDRISSDGDGHPSLLVLVGAAIRTTALSRRGGAQLAPWIEVTPEATAAYLSGRVAEQELPPMRVAEATKPAATGGSKPEDVEPVAQAYAAITAHYRQALALGPFNAEFVRRLGTWLKQTNRFGEALVLYLGFTNRWGRVFEVRYRLAATFAMSDQWLGSLAAMSTEVRTDLVRLLVARQELVEPGGSAFTDLANALDPSQHAHAHLHQRLLAVADAEWAALDHYTTLRASTARYLSAVARRTEDHRDGSYQRPMVTIGGQRLRVRRTVRAVRHVTHIQQLAPWPASLEPWLGSHRPTDGDQSEIVRHCDVLRARIVRAARPARLPVEARYALACAHARLWEVAGDPADAERAVHLLKLVLINGKATSWMRTMEDDADLAALHRTACFQRWWADLDPRHPPWDFWTWATGVAGAMTRRWHVHRVLALPVQPGSSTTALDNSTFRAFVDVVLDAAPSGTHASVDSAIARSLREDAARLGVRIDVPPPDLGLLERQMAPTDQPHHRVSVRSFLAAERDAHLAPTAQSHENRWAAALAALRGED